MCDEDLGCMYNDLKDSCMVGKVLLESLLTAFDQRKIICKRKKMLNCFLPPLHSRDLDDAHACFYYDYDYDDDDAYDYGYGYAYGYGYDYAYGYGYAYGYDYDYDYDYDYGLMMMMMMMMMMITIYDYDYDYYGYGYDYDYLYLYYSSIFHYCLLVFVSLFRFLTCSTMQRRFSSPSLFLSGVCTKNLLFYVK